MGFKFAKTEAKPNTVQPTKAEPVKKTKPCPYHDKPNRHCIDCN